MYGKIFALFLIFTLLQNANTKAQVQFAYQINFTDKNGTPFTLTSPLDYLSARSVVRRFNQMLPIDSTDLPVKSNYLDSAVLLTGGILHEVSRWLNLCVILVSDSSVIHSLDNKAFIKSTKLVGVYNPLLHHKSKKKTEPTLVNFTQSQKTTSDAGYYNNTWPQTTMVNGNYLNDLGFKGAGKLIAVLDAGFIGTDTHIGFDSLRTSGRLVDVHNFSYRSDSVYGYDNHGTCALSTMAGYIPNTFVGTAPLAMYALYITEIEPSENLLELVNLLCGAERADSIGADILTCSLGYNIFDISADNFNFSTDLDGKTTTAAIAANMATKKGMLFVASAGNEGHDAWNMILTPGDADSALTIGSVDGSRVIAYNSGFGPNAIGQVKPDVCAQGQPANIIDGNVYTAGDGTSFSTPQIAGWAACLWEGSPTATPYKLRTAIQQCADRYATPDVHYGYGIADFMCAAHILGVSDTPLSIIGNNWAVALPNPFSNELIIELTLNSSQHISIQLTDIIGKVRITSEFDYHKGNNLPLSLNTQSLPSGMYLLKVSSGIGQKVIKVVKR